MRLLVIEDDERGASYLVRGLAETGHIVDRAAEGGEGLAMASEGVYDVLIVDRKLPGLDGIDLVRRLRAAGQDTPVLMLSAIASMRDRVVGMQAGCDDYVAKPYAFAEVLARVEALARRVNRSRREAVLRVGDLCFDFAGRRAVRGGREIALQHRECLLLEVLMRHAEQIVTRSMLLEAAWRYDFEPRGNIIDRHVYRLRQKIDQGAAEPLIRTVRGAGYMMSAQGAEPNTKSRS